ncbi:MAG: tRNA lysidine(34) synthetase TilS [Desulfuromonadales bacterium]|nr:tRNA lysidine(34) synthetase TilS [Desulfuromonadales bacterium]
MAIVSDLHRRLTATIRTRQLFIPGDTLIIGLSGGADSTALLDLLATLPDFPLQLVAAHLNHRLRGADSDADEHFCRELAARYAIPFESRSVDVLSEAAGASLNLEDAGRRARIVFFDELVSRWQAAGVILAHHADDQAETVLMRLLRGSGMTGLAGMSWRNGRGYIRPLLDITRRELEAWLAERGLTWREDASNLDRSYLRNRIRHDLLPLLEEYNPAIRDALAATAGILSEEDSLLDQQARQEAGRICSFTAAGATCDISRLTSLPTALQRRIIRLMLSESAGNLEQFSHNHVENILQMMTAVRPNLRISLPQKLIAIKEYSRLIVKQAEGPHSTTAEIIIHGPGEYHLPDGSTLRIEFSPPPADPGAEGPTTVYLDIDRVPFPWHIRTFRPGDRIQPLGMSGRKKVKDIYIDEKIPLARRALIALVFCGAELIWITGLRISNPARVGRLSSRTVKCSLSA